jgi:hypothetical protein
MRRAASFPILGKPLLPVELQAIQRVDVITSAKNNNRATNKVKLPDGNSPACPTSREEDRAGGSS